MSLYGPLAKLEEERRQRRLQELDLKWKLTIRHMEEVQRVNEEAYRAKKAVMEAAVTRRETVRSVSQSPARPEAPLVTRYPRFGRPPAFPVRPKPVGQVKTKGKQRK
jgi:hypothetical protein